MYMDIYRVYNLDNVSSVMDTMPRMYKKCYKGNI